MFVYLTYFCDRAFFTFCDSTCYVRILDVFLRPSLTFCDSTRNVRTSLTTLRLLLCSYISDVLLRLIFAIWYCTWSVCTSSTALRCVFVIERAAPRCYRGPGQLLHFVVVGGPVFNLFVSTFLFLKRQGEGAPLIFLISVTIWSLIFLLKIEIPFKLSTVHIQIGRHGALVQRIAPMELNQDREPVLILRQLMGEIIAHQLETQHKLRTATQTHAVCLKLYTRHCLMMLLELNYFSTLKVQEIKFFRCDILKLLVYLMR